MSKIQAELLEVTELKSKRGEERQDLLGRIMKEVADLNDKEWDGLSQAAQDWFNDAADAKNAKAKVIPDFPDLETEEPAEEKKSSRRGAAKDEPAPAKPKVGVVAKITTKRGKTATGTIVELDDEIVVIKHGDGTEEEFDRSRIESIEVAGGDVKQEEPEADLVAVGAEVTLTTKRGKTVTGKIVELDDEVIVLDVDGKDEEFARDRVETIAPVKGKTKAAAKDEADAPKSSRRGAAKDEPETEGKAKRSSNPAGVSIGGRIREIMCDDISISEEDVSKQMKKEGLEFRDTSLKMIFKDTAAVFALLKAAKKLK